MRKNFKILKSALLLSAFFLSGNLLAQNNILELLPGSERLEYDQKTGTHRLYGNVNFSYQNNVMFCDSAYYFQRTNEVRAYGNVHINKRDTLNLYCDSLYYNGKTRLAKLWGHVRVRDNEYKLTCDSLDYDARSRQASYRTGGLIQSIESGEKLSSRIGYFHPESKNFFFSKDVKYQSTEIQMTTDTLRYLYSKQTAYFYGPTNIYTDSTTLYCEAGSYNTRSQEGELRKNAKIYRSSEFISGDTLLYYPKNQEYTGKGNVYMMDSLNEMSYSGNYAYSSDSLKYRWLTGRAVITKYLEKDTLYLHADTLSNRWSDSTDIMKAYRNAYIFSNAVQGRSDSLEYNRMDSLLYLKGDPILWSNKGEMKGRLIEIVLNDTILNQATIFDSASVIMPVEKDIYYNQIYGNKLVAYFDTNYIHRADVFGNAITIAFPEEEEKTDSLTTIKRIGMNRLYSSDIRVDLDSAGIIGVAYLQLPDGVFYPIKSLNQEEQFIPGFNDRSALKPNSIEELLDQ